MPSGDSASPLGPRPSGGAGVHARSMLFTLFGDYVRHYGGTIWIGSLIALMDELGFTASAVRAAVSRTTRQGWLAALRAGRASYYALTPRGEARVEEAARRIFKLHPERWDGLWRIVVLPSAGGAKAPEALRKGREGGRDRAGGAKAPEALRKGREGGPDRAGSRDDRAELRRELGWMGFAQMARGVYVTPNDLFDRLPALAERYGLPSAGEMFTARLAGDGGASRRLVPAGGDASSRPVPEGGDDAAAFAARHWDLPAIDRAYAAFVEEWGPRLAGWRAGAARTAGAPDLPGAEAFVQKTRLVHEFRKFLFIDPGLPGEVLPERWNGVEARGIFSAAYHLLSEPALAFFESRYRPAPGREGGIAEGRRNARRDPFRAATITAADLR